MSMHEIRVLLVEDDAAVARDLLETLDNAARDPGLHTQFQARHAQDLASALAELRRSPADAVLLDLSLPNAHGLESLTRVRACAPGIPILVLSASSEELSALKALREGADDYLIKPELHPTLMARAIRYAIERRRGAERLKRTEMLLAESQRLAMLGSWEWDLVTGTVTWTDELYRLFGLARDAEVSYDRFLEFVHAEDVDRARAEIGRTRETGAGLDLHLRMVRPDGVEWIAHILGRVVDYAGSQPVRLIGTARDVTRSREAEVALRESEERLTRIVETSAGGITIVDRSGRITFANPAAECILGLTRGEATDRTYDDPRWRITAVDGSAFPESELPFVRVMATAEPVHDVEHAIVREDGERVMLSVSAAPLRNAAGDVAGVLASLHDVTERYRVLDALRKSEEQLRQAQKMEAVGRLAGGVAHDFNNLLTAILGFSDMLLADLGATDARREDVLEIRKAADRATSLTRQLLAFSRQQVLQPRVMDVNTLIRDLERMLRRLIGEDVELATVLEPDMWPVMADGGQLEQVLLNLVVNARDAMPAGGVITIETSNLVVDERVIRAHPFVEPGEFAVLTVSDTGVGMDAKVQARVFEPFFTTKPAGEGTGLGLATVYGIVKQSGGYILLSSEVGRGTTFTILLPRVTRSSQAATRTGGRDASPGGSETVLLVEDEEAVRYLARRALQRAGYRVIDARHGHDALALCRTLDAPIDILITDVVMPEMGGRDLAERLATLQPAARVIFMSGYTDDEIIRRGLMARQTSFLQKPFTAAQLLQRVRQVLDGPVVAEAQVTTLSR